MVKKRKKEDPPPEQEEGEKLAAENDRLFLIDEVKAMKVKLTKVVGQQQALQIFRNQKIMVKDVEKATSKQLENHLIVIVHFLEAHKKGADIGEGEQGKLI